MGLLEKLFPQRALKVMLTDYFRTLNAYTPTFTSFSGGMYEMELTRAAIHSFASMCGKLKPEVQGKAYKNLEKILQFKPNPWMDTYKFIYRIATILEVESTAFILPMYAADEVTIVGFYPLLPSLVEIVQYNDEPWIRYSFKNGQKAAIELSKVGIITKYQYQDDFFGDGNRALLPTLNLMDIQKQGMEEAIKQSAIIRFMAKTSNVLRPEDIKTERERFSKDNLSADNKSGLLIYDAKFSEMKQLESKPFVIDADQMKLIQTNVYNYFGTNEKILQNSYDENGFNAYYEGKIEPFALQLGLVLSNMMYTSKELSYGNQIMLTSNRLQYASNQTKLQVSSQMFDRGILTTNQVMDIWNMSHVEDGDKRYIRKEYSEVSKLNGGDEDATEIEPEGVPEPEPIVPDPGA